MKKLLYILLFLLPTLGFSQSGDGYLNYTSYRTQCNGPCVFSRTVNGTSVSVSGHMNNTAEFDAAMTVQSNSNAVYVMNSGEALAHSNKGFGYNTNSTIGGRPTGQTQGEYYIVDYTGWFYASSTGNYKFHTWSDDSHEFWLDLDGDDVLESTELITKKYGGSGHNQSSNISLTSGTWYKLRLRFHEYQGNDWLRVQYQDPTRNGGTAWSIVGNGVWGDKVSNSEPEPDFTNNASDGKNAVYYKVFSTNGGDGTVGSHHPDNSSQFDALLNPSTAGTEWTHQGRDTGTKALTWPWPNTLPRPNDGVWFGWEITGYFVPEETGTYEFKISSDDRSDFYLDLDDDGTFESGTDEQVVYYYEGPSVYEKNVSLTKDTPVKFRVRYSQGSGGANLYLKWTKPSDTADNHTFNSDEIWSVKPEDVPFHYDVNYKFRNIDETSFSINTYYEVSDNEIAQNSNSSAITLDGNGEATITSQVDTDLVGQGKYDITATPGNVEWVVIYSPIVNNKYNYLIGLDVREFPSGVDLDDVNEIELLDLVDTDGTSNYFGTPGYPNSWDVQSNGSTWNNFYYRTWSAIDYSSSNYSSSIRNGGNYYALKTELNFTEVTAYKTQYVVFDSPTTTELETLIDDYFTVADVVMAFNELSGGGINGGFKGDFEYNVQYANADLSRDGKFDFMDTQLMLDFLYGGTDFDASYLAAVMSLTDLTNYESMTSTNWTNYGTTRTQFPLGLSTGTKQYDKSIAVPWKGDVNMSHSHLPSSVQTTSMRRSDLNVNFSSRSNQKSNSLEVNLEIEQTEEYIILTLDVPENNFNLVGSEFRVGFDNTKLNYEKVESSSTLSNFDVRRESYIKLGSISTDGSQKLNTGVTYKVYFKISEKFDTTLGLVSIKKSEVVDNKGNQINVIIK